ncbi:MAG: UDP-N-acetylmuramoyl-L-alanyl-D-glutamate--2,6-diaminopimelate ligase [Endomicrobiaceae bacterium]
MILKHLFSELPAEITGSSDIDIKGLSYDSRNISDGYLFFAQDGVHTSGKNYAAQAVSKGAVCVVSDKKIENLNCTNVVVSDVSKAMSEISAKFYDYPDKKMTVIGVTGTNGKTSITYMTESVFQSLNIDIGVIGTINYRYAGTFIEAPNTTPQSVDLYKMMYEMVNSGIKYLIMEVSSHSLVLGRISGIEFDIAVFTNLTQDHLDFHKNMESYFEAKKMLFYSLKSNVKNNKKFAIINSDDIYGRKILESGLNAEKISYSVNDADSKCRAYNVVLNRDNSSFKIKSIFGDASINIKHIGLHNVYNILAVFCICMSAGLAFNEVIKNINNALGAPGRLERVNFQTDFSVIVDYAHTHDALQNVLSAIKNLNPSRIITVFGCGGNRDKTKRSLMAQTACTMSDFVFITSDNPRDESPELIAKDVEAGAKQINKNNYKVIIDRKQAIEEAVKKAQKGNVVLIAGKGHENYQIIGQNKIHFDDREVALDMLKKIKK